MRFMRDTDTSIRNHAKAYFMLDSYEKKIRLPRMNLQQLMTNLKGEAPLWKLAILDERTSNEKCIME